MTKQAIINQQPIKVEVLFRGKKICIPLMQGTTVTKIKSAIIAPTLNDETRTISNELTTSDIKLMHKGKILKDCNLDFYSYAIKDGLKDDKSSINMNTKSNTEIRKPRTIKLIASGISKKQANTSNSEMEKGIRSTRIKDDLSEKGRMEIRKKMALGRQQLYKASMKDASSRKQQYGFGNIETLSNLPNEMKAKAILNELINDPGIMKCMNKHKWFVPTLAEMYPEGKVGESPVCVMGLNQNRGQKILLRLRTDDLEGFRKILSIKKVLYHELAHNVHSNHDNNFFMLMRQIENECNEWNNGYKSLNESTYFNNNDNDYCNDDSQSLFLGGTRKLGNGNGTNSAASASATSNEVPLRELAARAALLRMSKEEIQLCGICSSDSNNNNESDNKGRSNSGD